MNQKTQAPKVTTKTWREMCQWFGYRMAGMFREDNMSFINCMVEGEVISVILNYCYSCLIRGNTCSVIEELPVSEKNRLFLIIKDFASELYTKEEYIKACRALYALEYYLNSKE